MAELFGFNITRVKPKTDPKQQFSQPQAEDGTQVVAAGGFFGSYLDMEGTATFNPVNSDIVQEVLGAQSNELMARVESELVPEPNMGDQSGLFRNPPVNPTTPRNNAEEWTIDKFVINRETVSESSLSLSGHTLSAN